MAVLARLALAALLLRGASSTPVGALDPQGVHLALGDADDLPAAWDAEVLCLDRLHLAAVQAVHQRALAARLRAHDRDDGEIRRVRREAALVRDEVLERALGVVRRRELAAVVEELERGWLLGHCVDNELC